MKLSDAARKAVENGTFCITREGWQCVDQEHAYHVRLENSSVGCFLEREDGHRRVGMWQPTQDDLTADDWSVVGIRHIPEKSKMRRLCEGCMSLWKSLCIEKSGKKDRHKDGGHEGNKDRPGG